LRKINNSIVIVVLFIRKLNQSKMNSSVLFLVLITLLELSSANPVYTGDSEKTRNDRVLSPVEHVESNNEESDSARSKRFIGFGGGLGIGIGIGGFGGGGYGLNQGYGGYNGE
jgi:hypothetical protein